MTIEIILAASFFTLLGVANVKGYDIVRQYSRDHLPQFYLIMATIRILLVATTFGLYVFFTDNREDTIRFAIIYIIMYGVMMVVTLKLRH